MTISRRIASLSSALAPDKVAIGLLLLGAIFRFYRLGSRSFWIDELLTAHSVRLGTLAEVLDRTHFNVDQMPMLDILTWMLRGFGGTEWVVRLPSALAGSFGVLAIYILARTFGRPRAGLVAALLMATSAFSVWYSQEARVYALLMLLTTLQMLFAYRAVRYHRGLDWLLLAVCSVLNLYSHYLAIVTTATAFAFVCFVLIAEMLGHLGRPDPMAHWRRKFAFKIVAAVLTGAVTYAAYYPWLPYLNTFLNRSDLGFGRMGPSHVATLAEVGGLLSAFGFSGLLVVVLAVGTVAVAVEGLLGRWKETLLIFMWLGIPIGAFWLRMGGNTVTLLPRYLSFLFPAGILLAGIGVDRIAAVVHRLVGQFGNTQRKRALRAAASSSVFWAMVILLLIQVVPDLVRSYGKGKGGDYRGVAEYVIASSPDDSVVIGMGGCGHFFVKGLPYYFWLRHSSITVLEGGQLDDKAAELLQRSKGIVWGAVFTACSPPDNWVQASKAGMEVFLFDGIVLFRQQVPAQTGIEQAMTLLRWGSAFRPDLLSSLEFLEAVYGSRALGDNLLSTPSEAAKRWVFSSGSMVDPDESSFVLRPNGKPDGQEVNVIEFLAKEDFRVGSTYVISFRFRNAALKGDQRVYVSAHGVSTWLNIFPSGGGYLCPSTQTWATGAFAFTVSANTTALQVWLRATGDGVAEFKDVVLRLVQPKFDE